MAIVGHFASLSEAQKLVQSKLLAGVVQEIYEEGQLLAKLPVMTINSKSILYNRENTLPTAAFYDIHEQIPWKADVDYTTQKEATLKRVARQDILDKFMMNTYQDPNDYRTIILSELRKGCMRTIEDRIIYGDNGSDSAEFDGISKLFDTDAADGDAFTSATNLQRFDEGGSGAALSMLHLRQLLDVVKPKADLILMTRNMRNTLSATAFEGGIASTYPVGNINYDKKEFGTRVAYFDGIEIMVSDYLSENEVDNTAVKSTSTTTISSIYAIRFGQIMDGGLCLCTGGQTGGVDFFNLIELDDLEDYDASGMRLTAYCCLALGSSKAMGHIHSIGSTTAVAA